MCKGVKLIFSSLPLLYIICNFLVLLLLITLTHFIFSQLELPFFNLNCILPQLIFSLSKVTRLLSICNILFLRLYNHYF